MQSPNQKFRISAYAAEIIKMHQFSATTAKLLFALIFLQNETAESWPTILLEGEKPTEHFVFVNQLRELCFPAKTGSSRFLRKPVFELATMPEFFDNLQISENGRFLTWRFTEVFFHIMSDMEVYALIDASEIGHCKRKFDGALLAQIALHRKKRKPAFSLIAPNKDFEIDPDAVMPNLIPNEIKRQLGPSLQNWSNVTGISFTVLLVQGGSRPGYTDVVIRMRHKKTEWPDGQFLKQPPGSLRWAVEPLPQETR
ncbi:hypothetical protein [Ruegeria arenilitoris]|uniref:hypothetical protein n=1 Tax=Ruegeria arenilitoris TaxID=1173585 RepID=UPI00147F07E1|nr:hypothetical protein [Ruegeria arenilitoris]